ncbi:MAG: hypothetical protein J3R72DRAFT_495724 [Linnemannia gamsii]|nr:MAG: hypothetical protein J3R72DRAFT_495724 [Linnemannia gamsii]
MRVFVDHNQTPVDAQASVPSHGVSYADLHGRFADLCTRHNEQKQKRQTSSAQNSNSTETDIVRSRSSKSPNRFNTVGLPALKRPNIVYPPSPSSSLEPESATHPALNRNRIPRNQQRFSLAPSTVTLDVGTLSANTRRVLPHHEDVLQDIVSCIQEASLLAAGTKRKAQQLLGAFIERLDELEGISESDREFLDLFCAREEPKDIDDCDSVKVNDGSETQDNSDLDDNSRGNKEEQFLAASYSPLPSVANQHDDARLLELASSDNWTLNTVNEAMQWIATTTPGYLIKAFLCDVDPASPTLIRMTTIAKGIFSEGQYGATVSHHAAWLQIEDVEHYFPGVGVGDIKVLTLDAGKAFVVGAYTHLPQDPDTSDKGKVVVKPQPFASIVASPTITSVPSSTTSASPSPSTTICDRNLGSSSTPAHDITTKSSTRADKDTSFRNLASRLPPIRGQGFSVVNYVKQLQGVESALDGFYNGRDHRFKRHGWDAERAKQAEYWAIADRLLGIVGGSVGYLVVRLNEYFTSKRCPHWERFVAQRINSDRSTYLQPQREDGTYPWEGGVRDGPSTTTASASTASTSGTASTSSTAEPSTRRKKSATRTRAADVQEKRI